MQQQNLNQTFLLMLPRLYADNVIDSGNTRRDASGDGDLYGPQIPIVPEKKNSRVDISLFRKLLLSERIGLRLRLGLG
jgi:hypothetical protein